MGSDDVDTVGAGAEATETEIVVGHWDWELYGTITSFYVSSIHTGGLTFVSKFTGTGAGVAEIVCMHGSKRGRSSGVIKRVIFLTGGIAGSSSHGFCLEGRTCKHDIDLAQGLVQDSVPPVTGYIDVVSSSLRDVGLELDTEMLGSS